MSKPHIRHEADYSDPPKRTNSREYLDSLLAPLMLALFGLGGFFVVVCLGTNGAQPIDALGYWNVVVGAGFLAAGLGVVVVDATTSR
ncbi:cell division protein CrgA [Streptomyces sp. IBSBF 2394]|uniref:cell division protein CrgA n=1 Tax=Streptomyces sp. IBSBF 2394 TaxID=2903532 RepID=UPI002FDBB172